MEVFIFLFLVLIVFPRLCIRGYKQGKEEFADRLDNDWREKRRQWEIKNTLSFEEEQNFFSNMYTEYKKEIDDLYFLYPSLKSPPSKTRILRSLTLSQNGKIDRRNMSISHGGLCYRDYESEISYELFVSLVFYIDRNLKRHGMTEPLLAYKDEWVQKYDNIRHRSYGEHFIQIYEVNEKDKTSLIARRFEQFLWKPQLNYNELKEIKDYPYPD